MFCYCLKLIYLCIAIVHNYYVGIALFQGHCLQNDNSIFLNIYFVGLKTMKTFITRSSPISVPNLVVYELLALEELLLMIQNRESSNVFKITSFMNYCIPIRPIVYRSISIVYMTQVYYNLPSILNSGHFKTSRGFSEEL